MNYPGGPKVITNVLKSGRVRERDVRTEANWNDAM